MKDYLYLEQTNSTNELLWKMLKDEKLPEGFVVQTGFQTAGKGQIGNSWESESGKNLLFSIVVYPHFVPVSFQFLLSQFISVAIAGVLRKYTDGIKIKWPNDIYRKDKKIAGILIENSLQGNKIKSTVIGAGINVNQTKFLSDAPNPVSLAQITGKEFDISELLKEIRSEFMDIYQQRDIEKIQAEYLTELYRNTGTYYPFMSETESFNAKVIAVHPDGQLELQTEDGGKREFYFKEVSFII